MFSELGTRSVTPRPLSTPGKDTVPIVQKAGWAPGPVWTSENLAQTGFDTRTELVYLEITINEAKRERLGGKHYQLHAHVLGRRIEGQNMFVT